MLKVWKMNRAVKYLVFSMTAVTCGCASLSASDREQLDQMAADTVLQLEKKHPDLKEQLESIPGYMVINMNVLKIPVFGAGGGPAVVIDRNTGEHSYVKVSKLEFGAGWGGRRYKVLLAFKDPALLEKAEKGKWVYQMGAEVSAGKVAAEGSSGLPQQNKGYQMYILSEGGASATWTLRTIRVKPYR
jgi:hypothetical protein